MRYVRVNGAPPLLLTSPSCGSVHIRSRQEPRRTNADVFVFVFLFKSTFAHPKEEEKPAQELNQCGDLLGRLPCSLALVALLALGTCRLSLTACQTTLFARPDPLTPSQISASSTRARQHSDIV